MRSDSDVVPPRAAVRLVIADDERLARDRLRAGLARATGVEIVRECEDGASAVTAIREEKPDLVFLDVQMPGLDGFGVIGQIGIREMPIVVFVTAHDSYTLRAFEAHALDYLLKPYDDRRLLHVLDRAREAVENRRQADLARELSSLLRQVSSRPSDPPRLAGSAPEYLNRLLVREGDHSVFVSVQNVDWLEADRNYVTLHAGTREHRLRDRLSSLASQLDPRTFVRIHRSMIVNLKAIAELQRSTGGDYVATMRDGRKLRVSRKYAQHLMRAI